MYDCERKIAVKRSGEVAWGNADLIRARTLYGVSDKDSLKGLQSFNIDPGAACVVDRVS